METGELGPTQLSSDFKRILEREPIILGKDSIGKYFRNEQEISDIQDAIDTIFKQEDGDIAVGLVGSRLNGRFAYSADKLFSKLLSYNQEKLSMNKIERAFYDRFGSIPGRLRKPITAITEFLDQVQKQSASLSEIDLSNLPEGLQEYLRFSPSNPSVPYPFHPRDSEPGSPKMTILPSAAYYPDIDIAFLNIQPYGKRKRILKPIIGNRSGVCIQPTDLNTNFEGISPTYNSMIESVLPIRRAD